MTNCRWGRRVISFLFLLTVLFLIPGEVLGETEPVRIELLPGATAEGLYIELKEVARLEGPQKLIDKMGSIRLGNLPRKGFTVRIAAGQIEFRLRREGIETEGIEISGSDVVEVRGRYQDISSRRMQELIQPILQEKLALFFGVESIELLPVEPEIIVEDSGLGSDELQVPSGKCTIDVQMMQDTRPWGRVSITFNINVDGEEYRKIYRTYNVRVFLPVFVLQERVPRGTIINEIMFLREKRELSGLYDPPVLRTEEIEGREAKRLLQAGKIVVVSDLIDPPLIKRGETVKLIVRSGNLQISVMVEALEDGCLNEIIRVKNSSTGKVIKARVTGPGLLFKEIN